MATKDTAPPPAPVGYQIHNPSGTWFRLNAYFDMEDPTPAQDAGGPALCPKFIAGSYTQATDTRWTEAQWKAGVLTKYTGRPNDEGVKEVVYVAPAATPAPTQTPAPAPSESPAPSPSPSPSPAPVKK